MKIIFTEKEKATGTSIFLFVVRFGLIFSFGMFYGLMWGRGIWRD